MDVFLTFNGDVSGTPSPSAPATALAPSPTFPAHSQDPLARWKAGSRKEEPLLLYVRQLPGSAWHVETLTGYLLHE